MKRFLAAFAVCVAASAAQAADKPTVGAPPSWVRALPPPPAPAKGSEDAAAAVLQQDTQFRFDAAGQAEYDAYQVKVQSASGLAALGTIALNWSPSTDTLTVHRVRILRGAEVIDLLPKDGAFTVLRRESQLERAAMVNGVLTAVIQPEGLQVGDVLDVAYTLRREDALLRGRIDALAVMSPGVPVAHARALASWPTALKVTWKAADGMPAPAISEQGGETVAAVDIVALQPQPAPDGAPARFRLGRQLMFSNYAAWADVSALMSPLYVEAERLPPGSPVAAQAKAIAARTADPAARASAALALVQDEVRYLALVQGELGLKPAAADVTWSRRYGDCKGKTALLLALLRELGVEAEPVLASSALGDGLDARLPAASVFDHVLVRAHVGGRDYWLDGTRIGDRDLASISTPAFGFVLPVRPSGAALVHLTPEPAKAPLSRTAVRIDASKGIDRPAPFHVETTFRGDAATVLKLQLANLAPDDLDRALKSYWRGQYDFVTPAKVSAAFDPKAGEERVSMDGEAKMDWSNGGYEADGAALGWRFDPHRDPGPHADAPFAVGFPSYSQSEETIVLPNGGKGFTIWGENLDRELAGYAFHRKALVADGEFRLETTSRALKPEITLAQAQKDASALTELSKITLRLRSPTETAEVASDHKALLESQRTSRSGYIARGSAFLDDSRFAEALSDFDKAVDLDPGSAEALAHRGLAHAWLGQSAAAKADLDRAETLDPSQIVIWRARGLLAQRSDDAAAAVTAYTKALEIAPTDLFSLENRSDAYVRQKDYRKALADLDALSKAGSTESQINAHKAQIYMLMNDPARARALAMEDAGTDETSMRSRVATLLAAKDRPGARAAADKLVAAFPTAQNDFFHSATRDLDDKAGREADYKAAYALDKTFRPALASLAQSRAAAKDFPAALQYADALVALAPDDAFVRMARGMVRQRAGRPADAAEDFAFARAKVRGQAIPLNDLCYNEAMAAFDLSVALADCDASLALSPKEAATLDSRAFVLLRMSRDKDALAAFDASLAARADSATSLYGRSLAERRLGDVAAADRDRAAALAADAQVAATYESYGVTR